MTAARRLGASNLFTSSRAELAGFLRYAALRRRFAMSETRKLAAILCSDVVGY